MADRVHNLQSDQVVGEQLQRPVAITFRRFAQSHCDQLGFSHAIELARRGRFRAFLAVECLLETLGGEAFAEARLDASAQKQAPKVLRSIQAQGYFEGVAP